MGEKELSVRQWQEKFRAGAFTDGSSAVQCEAGWYDWFCSNEALAGRLKKISKVVMGITEPFILDNYYVWFKNNCPLCGPLYDDMRFEPLPGERNGNYFLVALDSPHEEKKWALVTERYGFGTPEFECGDVREMVKYINSMARELEQGVRPAFLTERAAAERYFIQHGNPSADGRVRRDGDHRYSYRYAQKGDTQSVLVVSGLEDAPSDFPMDRAERVGNLYVCPLDDAVQTLPRPARQNVGRQPRRKRQER